MRKKNRTALFLIIILTLSLLNFSACDFNSDKDSVTIIEINKNWQFAEKGKSNFLPATVPGCIHTDLIDNKVIPNPYYRSNEDSVQWIENKSWKYKTTFDCDESVLMDDVNELVFEGIDTYCSVFLNGFQLNFGNQKETNNMFREWRTDIKPFLKTKSNKLELIFHSATIYDSIKASESPYELPDSRAYSRKAQYQYGWDWGPRLVTSGIWKPVYIESWNILKIENIFVQPTFISDSLAKVKIQVSIIADYDTEATVEVSLENKKTETTKTEVKLSPGINIISLYTEIKEPKLWWPNGMGEQNLYTFKINAESSEFSDTKQVKTGLRDIKLVREKDSIGESFYFKINEKPFFSKGANYIPPDNFLPRVSLKKYESLVKNAAKANFNMLRVWGGGTYPDSYFYELCDQYGILLWQDFMFACNMYPTDSSFLENCKIEAIENVKRLQNHPSLALWCGNNENKNGWEDWGWQSSLNYTKSDSTEIWNGYLELFENILPTIVKTYNPNIDYWPSSPLWGWGHKECDNFGDSHYWGVWWGEEPFEMFKEKVPRFMSEFGFQAYPALRSIDKFTIPADRTRESSVMKVHQKHPRGEALINKYMKKSFNIPEKFEDYIYVSQLLQAKGMRIGIEAHRRSQPHCMGSLYWQYNDCWPVVSWSSMDYYFNWKALHYAAQNCFAPIMFSITNTDSIVTIYGVNDYYEEVNGTLSLSLMTFDGEILWSNKKKVTLKPAGSMIYYSVNTDDFPTFNRNNTVFQTTFQPNENSKQKNKIEKLFYFAEPKNLELNSCDISTEITKKGNNVAIKIKSNKLAKNVFLSFKKPIEGHFSKNYFDLLPQEENIIIFETNGNFSLKNIKKNLAIKYLNENHHKR